MNWSIQNFLGCAPTTRHMYSWTSAHYDTTTELLPLMTLPRFSLFGSCTCTCVTLVFHDGFCKSIPSSYHLSCAARQVHLRGCSLRDNGGCVFQAIQQAAASTLILTGLSPCTIAVLASAVSLSCMAALPMFWFRTHT